MKLHGIVNEDCRKTLKAMPDKCCDIFTDPPYNVGIDYEGWDDSLPEDEYKDFITEVLTECKRVAINLTVFTPHKWHLLYWNILGPEFFSITVYHPAKNGFYKSFVNKSAILLTNAKPTKQDQVESIWQAELPGIGYYSREERTGHPAYTTLDVTRRAVKRLCPSDHIHDPFTGKGTTAIAAIMMGKTFSGSELNPNYIRYAEDRIEREMFSAIKY